MELELATQAGDMVVAQEKKMEIIKEEVERDIRSQLRRQAAAHSDHLQDMLSVQVGHHDCLFSTLFKLFMM